MKSILSNDSCEKKEKPFPKLMIHTGSKAVWMMDKKGGGTVVHETSSSIYCIGGHEDAVDKSHYKDYEGSVCLSNE